jgi:hypothetical protein
LPGAGAAITVINMVNKMCAVGDGS